MRGPMFRSAMRGDRLPPSLPASLPEPPERPATPAAAAGVAGAMLSLAGLAVSGAVVIAVFFGIGLSRLITYPAAALHPPAPAAAPTAPLAAPVAPNQPPPALRPQTGGPAAPMIPPATAAAAGPESSASSRRAAAPDVAAAQRAAAPATGGDKSTASLAPSPVAPATTAPPSPPAAAGAAPATASSAQPAPAAPPSAAQIAALLANGDAAFRRGDLAAARLSYERAYKAGEGRGALGMGASYDPLFLRHFHIKGETADAAQAELWYHRAEALGATEAKGRLDRLAGKPAE